MPGRSMRPSMPMTATTQLAESCSKVTRVHCLFRPSSLLRLPISSDRGSAPKPRLASLVISPSDTSSFNPWPQAIGRESLSSYGPTARCPLERSTLRPSPWRRGFAKDRSQPLTGGTSASSDQRTSRGSSCCHRSQRLLCSVDETPLRPGPDLSLTALDAGVTKPAPEGAGFRLSSDRKRSLRLAGGSDQNAVDVDVVKDNHAGEVRPDVRALVEVDAYRVHRQTCRDGGRAGIGHAGEETNSLPAGRRCVGSVSPIGAAVEASDPVTRHDVEARRPGAAVAAIADIKP